MKEITFVGYAGTNLNLNEGSDMREGGNVSHVRLVGPKRTWNDDITCLPNRPTDRPSSGNLIASATSGTKKNRRLCSLFCGIKDETAMTTTTEHFSTADV